MSSTDPKDRELETSLYPMLRNREKDLEELRETVRRLSDNVDELRLERDSAIENCEALAAKWRAQTEQRLTKDKYEPPRVAREFARYNWTPCGMERENPGGSGNWAWCSVADILAFEDERAGMIARIEVLEQQDRKLRADKIVMPRYIAIDHNDPDKLFRSHCMGFNACIAAWFKLNHTVETVPAPEDKS